MKPLGALCLISFSLLVAASQPGKAASAAEINDEANATLRSFDKQNPSARELARKAAGFLVFPFVLGVQSRSVIIMFVTEEALAGFRNAYGWPRRTGSLLRRKGFEPTRWLQEVSDFEVNIATLGERLCG
jgi:lipid-binding SYLF domain-containing protein